MFTFVPRIFCCVRSKSFSALSSAVWDGISLPVGLSFQEGPALKRLSLNLSENVIGDEGCQWLSTLGACPLPIASNLGIASHQGVAPQFRAPVGQLGSRINQSEEGMWSPTFSQPLAWLSST